ncbi:prolyl oligopeptidase family serine peptidase [uncultured Paludibaculum sp.]|uniref:alpha/beta hydrolase family protein n=1 Tax=uncultured Paludibaculum sp. TaxID=1765020 RepID=UPI002AABB309|nr:prolyl oligopeptidase family serine peptidase [uncultured Paludibaculum sp.]
MRTLCLLMLLGASAAAQAPASVEDMVAGMTGYLQRLTAESPAGRRPTSEKLRRMIGVVDARVPFDDLDPRPLGETAVYRVFSARWPVLDGVTAEGLYYQPKNAPRQRVVVLSDNLRRARELAAAGCEVLAPVLIDTKSTYSGNPALGRQTEQPHREWIYRMAFPVGRHIYGYEVQKALAAVDWFAGRQPAAPIAIYGDGEGGAEAVFAAVLDPRIQQVETHDFSLESPPLWQQPLYRNVFGLLRDFGDAEFAALLGRRFVTLPKAAPLQDAVEPEIHMREQVHELVDYTQRLVALSEYTRAKLWKELGSKGVEERFLTDVIGRLPGPVSTPNVRRTLFQEGDRWRAYAVQFDVRPGVFGSGYLLVPKDLKAGEKRPLVVVQHGLNGRADVYFNEKEGRGLEVYRNFGAQLADLGFIVYSAQNPTVGEFRHLARLANPLGLSLYSLIRAQYQSLVDWLVTLPEVDAGRMGFYGLSYGGKTALRVPVFDERFRVVVCGGDFNEWIRKLTTVDEPYSYMFTKEYEILEWDMAHVASHAELAMMMAPRAFMVERGHGDGVGKDEWVAYEYAKVRRFYDEAGVGERTRIAYFNGPHRVDGPAAIEFLRKFLGW